MRSALTTLGEMIGLGVFAGGFFLMYPPLGVVVLGLGIFAISYVASLPALNTAGRASEAQSVQTGYDASGEVGPGLAVVHDLGMTGGDE